MTCQCKLCLRHVEYEVHIASVPEPAKAFFVQIYDDLNNTEFAHDWLKLRNESLESRDD